MASSTRISGYEGACTWGGGIDITGWTLDITGETSDVSDSMPTDAGWKETLSTGYKGWSGTFEGWYLDGTKLPVVSVGAAAEIVLTAETTASNVTFTGNCQVTNTNVVLTIDGEAVKFTATFMGDGVLAEVNA